MKIKQKQANKYLRRKFRGEGHRELRSRMIKEFGEKLDIIEECQKMFSWCAAKHAKPSLLRLNNWAKRAIRFRGEREDLKPEEVQKVLDEEVEKTKEKIKELK